MAFNCDVMAFNCDVMAFNCDVMALLFKDVFRHLSQCGILVDSEEVTNTNKLQIEENGEFSDYRGDYNEL